MPTLTQLQYIVAVDRLRHFGKAAKACHVSQPSLSMQLHKAEDELGVVLFDRNAKPVVPTDEGRALIEQARQVIREHERLLELSRSTKGEVAGNFHIAVIPTLASYLVPLFIDEFSKRYPHLNLRVDEMKTEDIIAALIEDRLDAALLATPLHESALQEDPVFYEPFFLYAHPSHPLLQQKNIKAADLDIDEVWLLRDGHCLRHQIINFCSVARDRKEHHGKDAGVLANVNFEGGTMETLRALIQKTKRGYTLLPQLFIEQLPPAERAASVRSFAGQVPVREVSVVTRRGHWKARMAYALGDTLKQLIPSELQSSSKTQKILAIESDPS